MRWLRGAGAGRLIGRIFGWAALAVLVAQPACADVLGEDPGTDRGGGWRLEARSDQHVDALRLSDLDRDDVWARVRPRPGRNLAYLRNEIRASYLTDGGWQWSLLARQRALAVVNEEALDLARAVQTGASPSADKVWPVQIDYLGFTGVGSEGGRRWALGDGWRLDLGLQALQLQRVQERRGAGWASYAAATQQYTADLSSHEARSGLSFPFQKTYSGVGEALLSRGGLAWQGERPHASWRWEDAGLLRWRGLPQQDLRLNSQITGTDANGYVVYSPLVTGQNSQPTYRRWMRPLQSFDAGWRDPAWGRWNVGLDLWPGYGRALPRGDWQQAWGDWRLGLGWRVHERRGELGLGWRGLWLRAGADREGRSRLWTLGWNSRF